MRKLKLFVIILSSTLFFIACSEGTKVAPGEMYPPMPKFAEQTPFEDGSGIVLVTEYDASGNVLKQGYYLNNTREGVFTEFYESGLVKSTCGYVAGFKQGQEVLFGAQGTVDQRATYHQGELDGPFVIYNRNRIKEKRNYKSGKLNGQVEKYYPNGTIMERSNYVDGQLDGVANWYDQQGNMTIEYRYNQGKRIEE